MNYITLIKCENRDWEIGFNQTNNLEEHQIFKKEMIECVDVEDVKIFKVLEVE